MNEWDMEGLLGHPPDLFGESKREHRLIQLGKLSKGNIIPADRYTQWIVTKATEKRVTISILGNCSRTLTYCWDGKGYTRQGQYLYKDGIR